MIKITIDTKALAAGLQAAQRKVDRCAAIASLKLQNTPRRPLLRKCRAYLTGQRPTRCAVPA